MHGETVKYVTKV